MLIFNIKQLQNKHTWLIVTNTHGTNHDRRSLLLTLRRNMKDAYDGLNHKTRNDIIDKIDPEYDSKHFFKPIKRMTWNLT